jgi:hypothetical protein
LDSILNAGNAQEQLGAVALPVVEEVVRRGLLDNFTLVHENHPPDIHSSTHLEVRNLSIP